MFWKRVLKRVIAAAIMYALAVFTYSMIFNKVLDVTIVTTIHETIKAETVQFLSADPQGDVAKFQENRKEYYYDVYRVEDPYLVKVLWRTKNTLLFDF